MQYHIYVFAAVLMVTLAQPPGGFLDSSLDVIIREANTSATIPVTSDPITVFPPYNTVVYQFNKGCRKSDPHFTHFINFAG